MEVCALDTVLVYKPFVLDYLIFEPVKLVKRLQRICSIRSNLFSLHWVLG